MSYTTLAFEVKDSVAMVTLNRPEVLNAINRQMQDELEAALGQALEQGARVVVLTGAGRGFCSGADVTNMAPAQSRRGHPLAQDPVRQVRKPLGWPALRLHRFPKPTIAAVNGVAAGAGLSLAMACDLRIAGESARFSSIFVRRALAPDYGCTYLLPRLVGMEKALEMMYTGDIIDAQEALRIGLVGRVVPDSELMSTAIGLAERLAQGPPITIELIKRVAYRSLANTLEDQMLLESQAQAVAQETEDYREGVRSFLEKRPPQFKGR
ncbi:MAG: enoyl-CoA hydratase/isomerase family protein [Chloroflexi bacterium]|nr:enoyl-CoA hydratase/isomerase family protein [Chloroflexota bacterium]